MNLLHCTLLVNAKFRYQKSESEMSVLIDEEPTKKRKKKVKSEEKVLLLRFGVHTWYLMYTHRDLNPRAKKRNPKNRKLPALKMYRQRRSN